MESLGNIVGNRLFEIPENQRGYSWARINLDQLLSDLELAGDKSHYMGPIIISGASSSETEDDYSPLFRCILEDGQQRLTSFFFILRALQLRFLELDGDETVDSEQISKLVFYQKGGAHLRIENQNTDLNACLCHHISASQPVPANQTAPMRAMALANNWAREKFGELDRDECLRWKNRLLNQARFILVDLEQEGVDRYLTFDAINSRGLPLSQFDKIKNFCILIDSRRSLSLDTDSRWYEALQQLDYFSAGQRSSEEAFITELFNVFHNTRVSQSEVHESFVTRYSPLLEEADADLEANLISFVRIWRDYAEAFGLMTTRDKQIHIGSKCSHEAMNWLNRLDNLDLPTITRPIIIAGYMTIQNPASGDRFEKLVEACEKYTFRVHAVMSRRKDANSTGVIALANNILRNSKEVDFAIQQICDWLKDWASLKEVINKLSNGEPKYYFDPYVSGWAYTYYFLYEYEVFVSPTGVSPLPWGSTAEMKRNTQEHILPQEHRDGAYWESAWPDEMDAEKFKHRLGNLVLTSGNSILGRKPIGRKLNDPSASYYFDCNDATNSEKLIRKYTNGVDWLKVNILRRELDLLNFAINRWSIPCCFDNRNIYLHEDFQEIENESLTVQMENCFQGLDEDSETDELHADEEGAEI